MQKGPSRTSTIDDPWGGGSTRDLVPSTAVTPDSAFVKPKQSINFILRLRDRLALFCVHAELQLVWVLFDRLPILSLPAVSPLCSASRSLPASLISRRHG